ncbi:MAG: CPBP family intramembrane metalloprotease, partial [Lachnospiraceae bacterium]|nr:CPBP family intramembrane metalloprotease [Lachnospiraceae bacterium]
MGRGKALAVGGVIWGLWHAPLTCIGHNFGTDYPGFPYPGILMMCLMCILMGVLLTFVTEKSGSVWPAVFLHAINNSGPSILQGFVNPDRSAASHLLGPGAHLLGLLVIVVPVLIIWYRHSPAPGSPKQA